MPYEEVTNPVRGPDAFGADGDAATLSQAAILLLLGIQLRGNDYALNGQAAAVGLEHFMEAIPGEDKERFPVPRLFTMGGRISFESVKDSLTGRYGPDVMPAVFPTVGEPMSSFPFKASADIAQHLYSDPNPLGAAQLMELFLRHPDELLRVAAATSYFDISAEPSRLLPVLVAGTSSDEALVRDMAATALAHVDPAHPRLLELTQDVVTGAGSSTSHTSLLVHGTFARPFSWWKPGGDFHNYILSHVRPDLYDAPDWLGWSGSYSDAARAIGADDLYDWARKKGGESTEPLYS
jgi:hypothetical protein